jgi:hypothetical protein
MVTVVHGTPGMKYGLSELSTQPNSFVPLPIAGSRRSMTLPAVRTIRAWAIAFQEAIAFRTPSWTACPSTVVGPVN